MFQKRYEDCVKRYTQEIQAEGGVLSLATIKAFLEVHYEEFKEVVLKITDITDTSNFKFTSMISSSEYDSEGNPTKAEIDLGSCKITVYYDRVSNNFVVEPFNLQKDDANLYVDGVTKIRAYLLTLEKRFAGKALLLYEEKDAFLFELLKEVDWVSAKNMSPSNAYALFGARNRKISDYFKSEREVKKPPQRLAAPRKNGAIQKYREICECVRALMEGRVKKINVVSINGNSSSDKRIVEMLGYYECQMAFKLSFGLKKDGSSFVISVEEFDEQAEVRKELTLKDMNGETLLKEVCSALEKLSKTLALYNIVNPNHWLLSKLYGERLNEVYEKKDKSKSLGEFIQCSINGITSAYTKQERYKLIQQINSLKIEYRIIDEFKIFVILAEGFNPVVCSQIPRLRNDDSYSYTIIDNECVLGTPTSKEELEALYKEQCLEIAGKNSSEFYNEVIQHNPSYLEMNFI